MEPFRLVYALNYNNDVNYDAEVVRANRYTYDYDCDGGFKWVHSGQWRNVRTMFGAFLYGKTFYTLTWVSESWFYDDETDGDVYYNVSNASKLFYMITASELVDNKTIVERTVKLEYDFLKEGIAESRAHGDAFYVKTIDGNIFYINPVTRKVCETDYFPPLVIRHTETYENGTALEVRLNEQGIVTFMAFGPQIKIFDVEGNGMSAIVVHQLDLKSETYPNIFFAAIRDESGAIHCVDTPYIVLTEDGEYAKITSVHPLEHSPGKLRVNGMTLTLGSYVPGSIGSLCDGFGDTVGFFWRKEDRENEELVPVA